MTEFRWASLEEACDAGLPDRAVAGVGKPPFQPALMLAAEFLNGLYRVDLIGHDQYTKPAPTMV